MCGIVGVVGNGEVAPLLVQSLGRLEYRGYDSCGVATLNGRLEVRKDVGSVADVADRLELAMSQGGSGIGHTRWATHGGVSRENAHPHVSCDGNFAVVHNGIISNYRDLRADLQSLGHSFSSETDTEVIAHLLEESWSQEPYIEAAFIKTLRRLEGSFAVAMLSARDSDRIFCAREKSPLILGVSPQAQFVASDVNAFLPYTGRAVFLEDGEYAVLSRKGCWVRGIAGGQKRRKKGAKIEWSTEGAAKRSYPHYMQKEIWEQPDTIERALEVPQRRISALARQMCMARRNILVGVGTTYYVALYGQYLMSVIAGESAAAMNSDEADPLVVADRKTLLLAISQSGETFDTLQAIRKANASRAGTAAIVNVPGSTMTREAGFVIQQNSGPEICVISTKAAMAQLVLLLRLVNEVARLKHRVTESHYVGIKRELQCLPRSVAAALKTQAARIRQLAVRYHSVKHWFFLGRGIQTPVAFESALKMKEVTYLHAEGMPAGFLKHGTLSLIDEETVSVFLVPPREETRLYDLTMSSVEEVRARKGKVIGLCFDEAPGNFDETVCLPKVSPLLAPLLHLVAAQLLAYETAVALGRNVDRPRSLAKSVTVA